MNFRLGPLIALYSISYMWYSIIAAGTAIIVGIITSYLTRPLKPNEIDPKLIIPIFDIFCGCLPKRVRKWLQRNTRNDTDLENKVCLSMQK